MKRCWADLADDAVGGGTLGCVGLGWIGSCHVRIGVEGQKMTKVVFVLVVGVDVNEFMSYGAKRGL